MSHRLLIVMVLSLNAAWGFASPVEADKPQQPTTPEQAKAEEAKKIRQKLADQFGIELSPDGKDLSKPVVPEQEWEGKIIDIRLRDKAPAMKMVTDVATWADLWKAWRGDEKLLDVDFKTHMVIVFWTRGPNYINAQLRISTKGDVRGMVMSTLLKGPGFSYRMMLVKREGFKSFFGKAIPD